MATVKGHSICSLYGYELNMEKNIMITYSPLHILSIRSTTGNVKVTFHTYFKTLSNDKPLNAKCLFFSF